LLAETKGRGTDRDVEEHPNLQSSVEAPDLDQHEGNDCAGDGSQHIGEIKEAEGTA